MKTILMLPSWYPTPNNPFAGCFFKEQAINEKNDFNFKVLHRLYKKDILLFHPFLSFFNKKITLIREEENTEEFIINIYKPIFFNFIEYIQLLLNKLKRIKNPLGTGYSVSECINTSEKKQLKRILKNNSDFYFDCIYGLTAQDMAITCKNISDISQKPLILAEHGPFPWPGRTISNLTKKALESCELFFAISNDKIRQVLLQNIKLKNIQYIGNLVDEDIFQMNPIPHNEKTFIIVAANSFYKQYSMFIKIFNELKEICNIPFKVMVVGYKANKGYSEDAKQLETDLMKSSFGDCIELIESVPRNELNSVYNRADCFIMTSIQEGQPVSAMEAGCCGLPIFSTRCGGVEDYINDKIGRIFNITDYKNFANSLKSYLEGNIVFDNSYIRRTIIQLFGKEAFSNNFKNSIIEILKDK